MMLRLVPEWRMTPGEWAEVLQVLGGLRDALSIGDLDAADRGLTTLAELAPTRLSSLGEADPEETSPVPEAVIDLVVEIQNGPGRPS